MEETKELITKDDICSKVYIIRGQQVMLDKDLAEIYGYEVKKLNQQVKRNIERFPEDFMFRLSNSEIDSVRSQIVTSRKKDFFCWSGRWTQIFTIRIYRARNLYACNSSSWRISGTTEHIYYAYF